MKWIRVLVMTLVIAPALLAGPMASSARCEGNCGVVVDGWGVNTYTDRPVIVGPEEYNTAKDRSIDDLRSKCNPGVCSGCGGSDSGYYASLRNADGSPATFAGQGMAWGKSMDPSKEAEVLYESATGNFFWNVYSHGMCICTPISNEQCEAGDCLIAEGKGRVELTTTQKVINTYQRVKQSIFKRLFGGKQ